MSGLKGAPPDGTIGRSWLPPLAVLSQALLLLGVEGLSLGLALGFLFLKGGEDAYLTTNAIGAGARAFVLVFGFGLAALAVGGGVLVAWRGRKDTWVPAALSHVARRLAPIGVAGFVPLLFQWRVWRDRDLPFLVLVGVAVLCLGVGLRVAVEAGPLSVEEPLWRSVRGAMAAGRARWPRLTKHLPLASVCVGALAYATYFSYHTVAWHWSVRSGYDLALESNLIWNVLHGGPFFKSSPLVGPVGSHFGFHATLFAYVIAPIYFFAQRAETLLVLQSVLLGAAAVPLFLFARLHVSAGLSALIALGYLLYPPVHGANLYEFHYLPLGTFFLWTTLYVLETRRNRLAIVAVILTLSVREDVSVSLGIWGAYLLITGRRPRAGIVVAVVSALYFVIIKLVLMPRFASGGGESFTFIFHQLLPPGENSFGSVLKTVIGNPAFTIGTILEPGKLIYVLQILVPLAFIPLGRPLGALFIVPGFFFTLLSTAYPPTVSIHYQYTAHWTTFMFVALVLALASYPTARRRAAVGAMVLGLLACSYQYGSIFQTHISWGGPIPYKFGITDEDRRRRRSLDAVLEHLPREAKVSASGFVTPQISSRPDDYSMTLGIYDAEYILFPTEPGDFIVDERQTVIGLLTSGTFGVVVAEPPFALARRGQATDANAALLARIR